MKRKAKTPLSLNLVDTRITHLSFEAIEPPENELPKITLSLRLAYKFLSKEKAILAFIGIG